MTTHKDHINRTNINPNTTGVITLTPLTKSGKPSRIGSSTMLVTDVVEDEDGFTFTHVSHHFVDNGVTQPYAFETGKRFPRHNPRVRVEFISVADAPNLAKWFGRLYYTQEMAKSDCE